MVRNLVLLDNLLDDFFNSTTAQRDQIQLDHDTNNYYIRAVVPGFEEKELQIITRGNVITLSGKQERSANDKKSVFSSFENRSFERSYTLPTDVQTDGVAAEYKAGILTVTMPRRKPPIAEIKTVPIKALGP